MAESDVIETMVGAGGIAVAGLIEPAAIPNMPAAVTAIRIPSNALITDPAF
jgi:hypothetical protein